MKRIVIFVLLVMIAGVAGVVVRSSSHGTVAELRELVSHNNASDVHQEIRQSYELSPGARVELSGLNGAVKIETSDTNKAEVFIERTAGSQEALDGRKVVIDADANSLRIHGEKCDGSFLTRIFGSSAGERVTLKLPRQIALYAKGVNGAFVASDIDGAVEVSSINGRVQIGSALGRATFKGINGNMIVGLKKLDSDGVTLNGINGNIELQLASDVNADFDARGMNGEVISELPNVAIDKTKRHNFSGRIGLGGAGITAKGINGNIRFTRTDL
ncbi:MAG TPA: hypothetical protein VHS05_02160 [Pyrinomonadaceae bacterium]|jgi:hypothetical protein|nr:hypothetical protein [Pyrinomonadaceae bacterium]